VFAQLRDMLAAKDSAVVPQKNQDGRLSGPQGAKTNLPAIGIGKGDVCELAAQGAFHGSSILSRAFDTVKPSASAFVPELPAGLRHFRES